MPILKLFLDSFRIFVRIRSNGMTEQESEWCVERLAKRQVRPTAIRILVLNAMRFASSALSLSDLEALLHTVDRSSIFRTLELFLQQHVVHAIEDGSGSLKYELCGGENECTVADMHIHFHCELCRHTYCLEAIQIPQVALPTGFDVHSVNYVIKGICPKCTRKR